MCGIFGVLGMRGGELARPQMLADMAASLHHRGPDSAHILRSRQCAIGATRLRIVDLSERAEQPFWTEDHRTWLACNGEIYNSADLRRRFDAYPYRSQSDVEVILPAYRALGLDVFRELDGMFALAIWDADSRSLILARDRAGEKPLFYARIGREFWFASEVQALLEHPGLQRDVDQSALAQYLTLGYPLEPRNLFAAVRRVESGTALVVSEAGLRVHRYWDPVELTRRAHFTKAPRKLEELRNLLQVAVSRQVVADAPVGVLLSGGLDSSLITAIAARALGASSLSAFTARFDAQDYDEGRWAKRAAALAGAQHFDVPCTAGELLHALRVLASNLAEPVSDPALLPSFLIARAAREHVRVVLSGEGADELFGGYPTYLGHRAAERLTRSPPVFKRGLNRLINALPVTDGKVTIEFLLKRFAGGVDLPWPERHVRWFGACGRVNLQHPRAAQARDAVIAGLLERYQDLDAQRGPMLLDYQTYLCNQLLVKMDRATMLNSIEGRAPFLDRSLSAFAFGLAPQLKLCGWTTKWILKQAAKEWLPRDVRVRRKRGLSVPLARLFNAEFSTLADQLLAPERLNRHGLMNPHAVARLLQEHRARRANHAAELWSALILELWLERWQPALAGDYPFADAMATRRTPKIIEHRVEPVSQRRADASLLPGA